MKRIYQTCDGDGGDDDGGGDDGHDDHEDDIDAMGDASGVDGMAKCIKSTHSTG